MAHFKAGRQDQGRRLFAETVERMDRELPKPGKQRITGYENWLICQIIKCEAEKTITGMPATQPK